MAWFLLLECRCFQFKGVIIAVDSTDLEKLPELKSELNAIANHEELRDVPFLVLANKQDAPGAAPPSEISMR